MHKHISLVGGLMVGEAVCVGAGVHGNTCVCVCVCVCVLSHVQFFVTPRALHVPLSMGLSQKEYGSGLSFPFAKFFCEPKIALKNKVYR